MRRWLLLIVVIVVLLSAVALRHVLKAEAKKKREATYQSALEASYQSTLQAYSQNLRAGLTRKDVENCFRAREISFGQMCCVEERSAFADLVKIGEERAPWYCSEGYVYVAFEFSATESRHLFIAYDSDVLKTVRIFRQLGGCL